MLAVSAWLAWPAVALALVMPDLFHRVLNAQADWALDLPINALYATTLVAVVPLLVLWFGIYLKAKIIVVFLFAVFPVLINTIAGLKACDAGKVDLMPGRKNHMWIQADQVGHYYGQCAEFCGLQHAHMSMAVVAQTPADFRAWLAHESAAAAPRLPESAIVTLTVSGEQAVFIEEAPGRYRLHKVTVMGRQGNEMVVRGLPEAAAGASAVRVVTRGTAALKALLKP